MNERDKELYEQAEKYADVHFKGEGGAVWVEAFESKFADLIRADEREKIIGEFVEAGAVSKNGTIVTIIRARATT